MYRLCTIQKSCLPPSVLDNGRHSQFSIGCNVTLPPESFLAFRLPFVYGLQMDDKKLHPLNYMAKKPELTAWLVQGTTLRIVSGEVSRWWFSQELRFKKTLIMVFSILHFCNQPPRFQVFVTFHLCNFYNMKSCIVPFIMIYVMLRCFVSLQAIIPYSFILSIHSHITWAHSKTWQVKQLTAEHA